MSMATEAERFRTMTDAEYADLQNGRTTVEAILATPDYAEKIARDTAPSDRGFWIGEPDPAILAYGARCAREGYTLGYGAAQ